MRFEAYPTRIKVILRKWGNSFQREFNLVEKLFVAYFSALA